MPSWLIGPLIKLALALGACLIVWGVIKHVEGIGYDRAEAVYKPQLQKERLRADTADAARLQSEADVARIRAAYADQTAAMAALQEAERQAQIAAQKALAVVAANAKHYTSEIARLQAIAAGPPLTGDTCAEADRILRGLATDRVRH